MSNVTIDEEGEVIEAGALVPMSGHAKAELDVQILTAQQIGRSLKQFKNYALEMATYDEETASSCFYVIPRGGKNIEGPSVRLAEIAVCAWRHMRTEKYVVDHDAKTVTARGVAWDLFNNVAMAVEVKRKITDKYGKIYSDDMIVVTGQAAASVAYRNAVFAVIPNVYIKAIYEACREVVRGDIKTLSARRSAAVEALVKLGAQRDRIFSTLGVKGIDDVDIDKLVTLKGIGNAIREQQVTIDEAFPEPRKEPNNGDANVEAARAAKRKPTNAKADPPGDDLEMASAETDSVFVTSETLNQITALAREKGVSDVKTCRDVTGKEPQDMLVNEGKLVLAHLRSLTREG